MSETVRPDFAKRFGWQDGDIVLESPGDKASAEEDPPKPPESVAEVTVPAVSEVARR